MKNLKSFLSVFLSAVLISGVTVQPVNAFHFQYSPEEVTDWGDPNRHPGGAAHSLWELVSSGDGTIPPTTPESNPYPTLTIITNHGGSVFTDRDSFAPGEEVILTAISDARYYLSSFTASTGTLYTQSRVVFTYIMPYTDATLTFTFSPAQPLRNYFPHPLRREPVMTIRDFTGDDIMDSYSQVILKQ